MEDKFVGETGETCRRDGGGRRGKVGGSAMREAAVGKVAVDFVLDVLRIRCVLGGSHRGFLTSGSSINDISREVRAE